MHTCILVNLGLKFDSQFDVFEARYELQNKKKETYRELKNYTNEGMKMEKVCSWNIGTLLTTVRRDSSGPATCRTDLSTVKLQSGLEPWLAAFRPWVWSPYKDPRAHSCIDEAPVSCPLYQRYCNARFVSKLSMEPNLKGTDQISRHDNTRAHRIVSL